jgi:peptidoglycan/LPS O-acetylase OafA/YrhL
MQRSDTQVIKGGGILFMLFFHLFNRVKFVALCNPILYINDDPLCHLITRALDPVDIFLILSGYGLWKASQRGDKNRWLRIAKLLVHYWIILATFLCLAIFMQPEKYPGSVIDLINNFTTFKTSYNGEMWFLMPYLILSLLSPLIFKIIAKVKYWLVIVVGCYFLSMAAGWSIPRGYFGINQFHVMKVLANTVMFISPFVTGAVAAKYNFFDKCLNNKSLKRISPILLAALLVAEVCWNKIPLYCFWLVTLFVIVINTYKCKPIYNVLKTLGDNSMNMWMIHSWFCYRLFVDFTYSFKNPLLIFIILVAISYALSLVFNVICKPIEKYIGNHCKFLIRE